MFLRPLKKPKTDSMAVSRSNFCPLFLQNFSSLCRSSIFSQLGQTKRIGEKKLFKRVGVFKIVHYWCFESLKCQRGKLFIQLMMNFSAFAFYLSSLAESVKKTKTRGHIHQQSWEKIKKLEISCRFNRLRLKN